MHYELSRIFRIKKKVEETDGIDIELDDLNPVLFDYQKAIVKKALKRKDLHYLKRAEWERPYSNWNGHIK